MDKLTDDWTALHNDVSTEADGNSGFFQTAGEVLAKGIPLSVASGVVSMYNTAASLGNVLGADMEKIDLGVVASQFDDNLGAYYQEHKQGVDLAGFLATSIVPGMGGIKALKMLQGGVAGANAAEMVGAVKNTGNVFNLFRNSELKFTENALDKIRLERNAVFSAVDNDKLLAIASGALDQAFQGAAFQTAVLLTMNQSPILSHPDEGYFASFFRNSPEILTAAGIQGAFGGGLNAFTVAGKLKKAIYARDLAEFPSLHANAIGFTDLDQGTGLAADFAFWQNKIDEFEKAKAGTGPAGGLTDRQILNYQQTLNNQEGNLRERLSVQILGKGNERLNDSIWELVKNAEDPAETATLFLSGARKIEHVTAEDLPSTTGVQKVLFQGEPLAVERKAANLVKYAEKNNLVYPFPIDGVPTDAQVSEMAAGKSVLYKNSQGIYNVVENSKYVQNILPRNTKTLNPTIYVRIAGDEAGKISTAVFPTVGDLGEVTFSKQSKMLIDGKPFDVPADYDPVANNALTSNSQFVKAANTPLPIQNDVIIINEGDIPLLEAVVKKGTTADIVYNNDMIGGTGDLLDILQQEKLKTRALLVQEGHGYDEIARELNVTRDFAERGTGDGFLLAKDENHLQPQYMKISYATGPGKLGTMPDGFYVRGVADVMSKVQLAANQNQNVAASILGPFYKQLANTDGTLLNTSTIPSFSTFISSASNDYGTLGAFMEQSGKVANMVKKQRTQDVYQALQAPQAQILARPAALSELNIVLNKVRSQGEPYKLVESELIPKSVYKAMYAKGADADVVLAEAKADGKIFTIENKEVRDYLGTTIKLNDKRVGEWNQIFAAKGSGMMYDAGMLYLPPINTRKYPWVAFVKEKMDMGAGDLKQSGVVVATTSRELEAKANQIRANYGDRFEVYTPSEVVQWKKIQGEYENSPLLGDSMADSALKKEGLLYEFQPRIDAEIFNDFNEWHWRQEGQIVNQSIELKYAQEFAELRAMGKNFENYAKNPFGGGKVKKYSDLDNPYLRYIDTALDKPGANYESIWGKFNGLAQNVAQKVFSAWDSAFAKATAGETDWITANKQAESYGFTPPYKGVINDVLQANIVQPKVDNVRSLQGLVAKVNGSVSTLTLGLDFLNSVLNVLSFPVMGTAEMRSVVNAIKNDPTRVGALASLTKVEMPGSAYSIPSPMKLLVRSVGRLFSEDRATLAEYYDSIGAIPKKMSSEFMGVVDASVLSPEAVSSPVAFKGYAEKLHAVAKTAWTASAETASNVASVGKNVTGYNKAEFIVRFLAADMMKQLTDAAGIAADEAPSYINSFANRVHGNYLANQRPHLFQGPVGQAISLFQTYQFNVLQNMVRYVERGDKGAVAQMLAMQNTLFGLQGNPAFYALNDAIGKANDEHRDIVNSTQAIAGNDVSKWILYGLGSNALHTSLYNRGDLTPRYATIVPTAPLDIPGISIPIKAITSLVDTLSNIVKGGNVKDSILDGVSHFGLNRPIMGLAQLAAGQRTASNGDLLTAYSDLDGMLVAAKLAGGEELNRSIALDAYYRNLMYKKHDQDTINSLGEAVKTSMYKGQVPTPEQMNGFVNKYVNAGGTPQGINRWLMNANKNANESQLNILAQHFKTRPGRLQAQAMGGDTPDYWNSSQAVSGVSGVTQE